VDLITDAQINTIPTWQVQSGFNVDFNGLKAQGELSSRRVEDVDEALSPNETGGG
jgi:hypothetical protein